MLLPGNGFNPKVPESQNSRIQLSRYFNSDLEWEDTVSVFMIGARILDQF
jgi:hypothetical protein